MNSYRGIFGLYNPKHVATQKWICNWYQRSLLTIIRSPQKMQCNFKDRMNGQQWLWYHIPLKTKNNQENLRMHQKRRMNKNVKGCKAIYSHKMFLDCNYSQIKHV